MQVNGKVSFAIPCVLIFTVGVITPQPRSMISPTVANYSQIRQLLRSLTITILFPRGKLSTLLQ